jgi:hypothetical protein
MPMTEGNKMYRWFAVLFLILSGCTATLRPAPWVTPTAGPGDGTTATAGNIRVEARVNAWEGVPENLHEEVTPVLVTITNDGSQPVRIRYNEFRLVSPAGQSFAALPPFEIEGSVLETVTTMTYPPVGFGFAPYLSSYYPGMSLYYGPYAYDWFYYHRYYPVFRRVQLPTGDMIQKALPEGVLEPQGRVSGFLYFEEVSSDISRVDFRADIINAQTDQQFAEISIPFVAT